MSGTMFPAGAGEFWEGMAEVARYLVGQTPQQPTRVAIIPTAAAQEEPRARTDMRTTRFQRLACYVEPIPPDYTLVSVDEHTAATDDGQRWQ